MKFSSVKRRFLTDYRRPDSADIDESTASIRSSEQYRTNYYAFTSLEWDGRTERLFCGTTNFANDLLYTYDPAGGQFESMNYRSIAERYEIKIHRGLCIGADGCVYGATSCLHGIDELSKGPGGKLFRFDPARRSYEVLGVPIPQLYIQTISLDSSRQMVYGMAFPVFEFFAFDIQRRRVVYRQYMGSISHVGAVDDEGGYWGTWLGKKSSHNLFRYDPAANEVRFFDHGFPTPCRSLMYRLAGPIDSMLDGGDGWLYIGHESGELYRLDWHTGRVEYLCKPLPGQRLPGLAIGPDGLILGVGGSDASTMGFAYDRKSGQCEILGSIRDEQAGADCFRTHDCCLVGQTLFVGETDNPARSCYLWECTIG